MTLDSRLFADEHEPDVAFGDLILLRQLWPFVKPHRKALLTSLLLLPLMTGAEMAQPYLVRQTLDGPVRTGDMQGLFVLAGIFLALLGVYAGLRYAQMYLAQITGERIIYDLRTQLYAHLQKLSPRFYHQQPIGKLVTRLSSDVENLSEMFSSGGLAILTDIAVIGGALVGMFLMNWRLALLTSVMLPILVGVMEFFRKRSRRAYDEIRVNVARMNAFLQENISGMDVVRLYGREDKNLRDFEALNADNLKTNLSSVFYDCSFTAIVEFLTNLTLIGVLWFGGEAITRGEMTFGLLVAFFWYVQMMFNPIEDLSEKYTIIQSGLASIHKIMPLFNRVPEIVSPSDGKALPKARGEIVFENVSFGYLPNRPVLKDINFSVNPGEKIALVGPSGSGKTTIIKLLSRFYDVTSGTIRVDGRDVRDYDLADLRRNVVTVQQDDFLFSRSVAENITLNANPALDGDLERQLADATTRVRAKELIQRLPQGFAEPLKERGRNLSGGERQLLLFARAVFHDPAILVLDEATSAIDNRTEHQIQEALDELMADRTVLVIAHRLSTLQKVDRILVIEHGRIAESGNHEALMAQNGIYAQFFQYQQTIEALHPGGGFLEPNHS